MLKVFVIVGAVLVYFALGVTTVVIVDRCATTLVLDMDDSGDQMAAFAICLFWPCIMVVIIGGVIVGAIIWVIKRALDSIDGGNNGSH